MALQFIQPPLPLAENETISEYGYRLEELGFDEMRIRKLFGEHCPSSGHLAQIAA